MQWERAFAVSGNRLHSSAIRDLLAVTATPEVISFAGGLPAAELFPADDLRVAFATVLAKEGERALQYGPTEGDRELREYLVHRLATRGIRATPDEVLITTGSQQGLDLLCTLLLGSGVTTVVESPSYVGALQAFARSECQFATVPLDDDGMQVDAIEDLLTSPRKASPEPALVYTIPTFQNPSGVTLAIARRRQLLAVCRQHSLPLIEDDPYSELRYEGGDVPAVRALPGGDDVIYLGTFSKILAPGLRLGWVVAPRPVIQRLELPNRAPICTRTAWCNGRCWRTAEMPTWMLTLPSCVSRIGSDAMPCWRPCRSTSPPVPPGPPPRVAYSSG